MKLKIVSLVIAALILPTALSAAGENMIKVKEMKIERVDGRVNMLLVAERATETHEVRSAGRYTVYFRNTVFVGGGDRFEVAAGGVRSISIVQVKPDVVAVEIDLEDGYEVLSKGYDEKRGGFLFFTKKLPASAAKEPKSPLELEAEQELDEFLRRLRSGGARYLSRINRVVIDPGHGGFDSGAVGPTGLKEKDVVLDIARRVKRILLSETNIMAFLTRRDDYYIPLSARTVISNKYRADLFVSIHANASKNRSARGFEVYYCSDKASSKEAEALAKRENISYGENGVAESREGSVNIEKILFDAGRKKLWNDSRDFSERFFSYSGVNLGIPKKGVHSANFFVLRKARMPSILIEVAYISNPVEEDLLRQPQFREKVAREIVKVIRSADFR
ncbi:hypothetical protein DRQ05_03235 [bacterium]|nr:MAG: hypothetical protein DRQ05_03235 [bacterium]